MPCYVASIQKVLQLCATVRLLLCEIFAMNSRGGMRVKARVGPLHLAHLWSIERTYTKSMCYNTNNRFSGLSSITSVYCLNDFHFALHLKSPIPSQRERESGCARYQSEETHWIHYLQFDNNQRAKQQEKDQCHGIYIYTKMQLTIAIQSIAYRTHIRTHTDTNTHCSCSALYNVNRKLRIDISQWFLSTCHGQVLHHAESYMSFM